MNCPYCTASLPDGSRLCQYCGRLLASSAPPQQSQVPVTETPGPAPGRPGGFGQPETGFGRFGASGGSARSFPGDPYSPTFDASRLPLDQADAYRQHRFHATSSVLMTIVLHFVTLGTLSWFLVARKHAFLPRIKPDDFSARRAAGFLFIPFFNLYWFFVLLRRTSDRLRLQTMLWGVGTPPSRALATALAISLAVGAVPYVFIWPFYLGRMQAACNALALAAAPESARASMLQLERWARLRWLGWTVLGPAIVIITSAAGVLIGSGQADDLASLIGMGIFAVVAAAGGALLYTGSHQTRSVYHALSESTPWIVAGYLRIDKNAAWTVCGTMIAFGVITLVGALGGFSEVMEPASPDETSSSFGQATGMFLLAAYAWFKALQLRHQIRWLETRAPLSAPERGAGG
jgi:hypothetical protein